MIPKTIHYCWFGGKPKPKSVLRCIESWRRFCPDYEVKEWNEQNFDVCINEYCEEAYKLHKWAFVSDVARLWALINEGGVYLDTDVEVIKPIDDLLSHTAFLGFEGSQWIGTNIIGTTKGNRLLTLFFEEYKNRHYQNPDGTLNQSTNVVELTLLLLKKTNLKLNNCFQDLQDVVVYPSVYFNPYDYVSGKLRKTEETYTIHWYSQSWMDQNRWRMRLRPFIQIYHRLLNKHLA